MQTFPEKQAGVHEVFAVRVRNATDKGKSSGGKGNVRRVLRSSSLSLFTFTALMYHHILLSQELTVIKQTTLLLCGVLDQTFTSLLVN